MFEVHQPIDVKLARDIGPQKRSAIIIDNFYENPDEVRELCLRKNAEDKIDSEVEGLAGTRIELEELGGVLRDRLGHLFCDLCFDTFVWGENPDPSCFFSRLEEMTFAYNIVTDKTLVDKPIGIIPHQEVYEACPSERHSHTQFGGIVFLNKPEECRGGTNLYSLDGEMTVPYLGDPKIPWENGEEDLDNIDQFKHIRSSIDNDGHWKVEHTFEMVYNRFILYQGKNLHAADIDLGWFNDETPRINQVFFL